MAATRPGQTATDGLTLAGMERFFEEANIGLAITSPTKGWVRANRRLREMLGYSMAELSQLTWAELTHPDDLNADLQEFERVLQGEIDGYEMNKRFIRRDGEILHTHLTVGVQRDAEGELEMVSASLQDIGAQVGDRAALEASEERYRLMMESSLDGVFDWRPQQDQLYLSPRWKAQLGYQPDELPDDIDSWISHLHPDDVVDTVAAVKAWVEKPRGNWEREFRMIRRDGTVMHVLARAAPVIDQSGRVERAFGVHVDITSRKKLEEKQLNFTQDLEAMVRERTEEARMAEARYRAIADFTYDWEMAWSRAGDLTYVSPSCERICSYSAESLSEQPRLVEEMIAAEDREFVDRQISAAREQARTTEISYRIIDGRNQLRWVERAEHPMRDEAGRVTGFRSSVRDITERVLYDEALRSEKEFTEAVVNTARAIIVVLDPQARIVTYNTYLEAISGRPLEQYVGRDWFTSFLPPGEYDRVRERFRESIATQRADGFVNPITTANGDSRDIAWYDELLRDEHGEITGLVAVGHDVTEINRVHAELQVSEERFRSYFELGLIGMALTSLEKGWEQVNDRLCEILGYPREELVTKTWAEITHPDDIEADETQFHRVLDGEIDGYSMEKRFLHGTDGHVVHARISARCLRRDDGSVDHFVAIVDDISDMKQAQLDLQQLNETLEDRVIERTQKLNITNRQLQETLRDLQIAQAAMVQSEKLSSVGSLAAGVAHELNNPLMGVLNYVDFAHSKAPADSREQQMLAKAQAQLHRMGAIVRNLLDLSRPDTGTPALIDPAGPVNRAIDLLAADLRARDISVDNRIEPDRWQVWATDGGLQQVMLNLLINARDALASAERRQVTIDATDSVDGVEITICDSGPGVTTEIRHRIFDPFFSTKDVGAGSGLGLSVSASIMRAVGGELLLDSNGPGRTGACFLARLRTAPPAD